MKQASFFLVSAAVLATLGAGCGDSPVSLDKYNATSTAPAPSETAAAPTPAPSESTPQPTPTPAMNPTENTQPETLAFPGVLPMNELQGKKIHMKTTKGDIVFELLPADGPKAASNFYYLTKKKYYDGLTFHRIVPGFVAQGGDPTGTGMGGPGYQFADDVVKTPYHEGIVAMANAGPNTNGSQFFIMIDNWDKEPQVLPPSYSVFGRVTAGLDVAKKLEVGDKMTSVTVE